MPSIYGVQSKRNKGLISYNIVNLVLRESLSMELATLAKSQTQNFIQMILNCLSLRQLN